MVQILEQARMVSSNPDPLQQRKLEAKEVILFINNYYKKQSLSRDSHNFLKILADKYWLTVSEQITPLQLLELVRSEFVSSKSSSIIQKRIHTLPNEVITLIEELELPDKTVDVVTNLIVKIAKFLELKKLQYKIIPDTFVDYEYPEWQKIKLRIMVNRDLSYLYQNLKQPIYDIVYSSISSELDDKILIKLESYKENDSAK